MPFERVDFDFSRTGSDMIYINTESSTCSEICEEGSIRICPERSLNPNTRNGIFTTAATLRGTPKANNIRKHILQQ